MNPGKDTSYWHNIADTVRSLGAGLKVTFAHFLQARKTQAVTGIADENYFTAREGIATIQYPYEMQPVPDTGRYRLHNEIDDCIVCDKCAKVCPVNCITIEPIRATEEIGKTSDGTSKRIYAATFDIDMGKCCFCGLCTTVCPTECLTMTKVYDFSVTDIREHNFVFGEMTPAEIEEKKKLFEEHQKNKAAAATTTSSPPPATEGAEEKKEAPKVAGPAKPVFKPKDKTARVINIAIMNAPSFLFYFFGVVAAGSALALLFIRNVFYGALLVIAVLLALAGLYILAFAEFVAVTQILVYAGGILVVIIFGIMLTTRLGGKPLIIEHTRSISATLVGMAFFGTLVYLLSQETFEVHPAKAAAPITLDATQTLGASLMSNYVLPFEVAGVLLLMALIGAAVIASERKSKNV